MGQQARRRSAGDKAAQVALGIGAGRLLSLRASMLVLKGAKPRWDISVNQRGHVSLHPSVWVRRKPIALLGSRGKSFGANNADNGSLMLSERGRVIKTSA